MSSTPTESWFRGQKLGFRRSMSRRTTFGPCDFVLARSAGTRSRPAETRCRPVYHFPSVSATGHRDAVRFAGLHSPIASTEWS
jgi:hypothetical protein